jgi:hypothetical protein
VIWPFSPLHHPILLVAEGAGAKPERPVLLVDVIRIAQSVDGLVDRAAFRQGEFGIPLIVDYAELPQVVADVVQDGVQTQFENVAVVMGAQQGAGTFDQGVDVGFLVARRDHLARFVADLVRRRVLEHPRRRSHIGAAVFGVEAGGDVAHVIAPVAVAGKAKLFAAVLQIAQPNAGGQDIHLPAGVVDIVFAVNPVADRFQQIGDGGAERRAAAVADVQRAGGVGGDELHLYPLAAAKHAPTEAVPLFEDLAHRRLIGGGCQEEIDETRPGDIHLGDMGGWG